MKTKGWTVLAAAVGLLGVLPCALAGQTASLRVSATVRAPQEQPLVHLAAPRVEGGNHAVIVGGTRRGEVRIEAGGEEFVLPARAGGEGRVELTPAAWASVLRQSSKGPASIRVIVAPI